MSETLSETHYARVTMLSDVAIIDSNYKLHADIKPLVNTSGDKIAVKNV